MDKPQLPGAPAQPDEDQLVLLGVITKPQGIKGGLRLMPQFDDWDDFENLKTDRLFLKPDPSTRLVRDGSPSRPQLPTSPQPPTRPQYTQATIREFTAHQRFLVLFLEEAPDLNAAENFRGLFAYVYEDELWDLPEGRYYAFQLEGLELYDTNRDAPAGTVKAMRPGVQDYLIITKPGNSGEFLIPYVPEIVTKVDLEQRRITANLPPGIDEM